LLFNLGRLSWWLKLAAIEDGNRPGATQQESDELRDLKKRNRQSEQENEILRRVACRVPGFTKQAFCKWRAAVSHNEITTMRI